MTTPNHDSRLVGRFTLLTDASAVIGSLPRASVDCVVTSPPYWRLRDYPTSTQVGLEDCPQDYIDALVGVFRITRRALKSHGSLWVNLGDNYAGNSDGYHCAKPLQRRQPATEQGPAFRTRTSSACRGAWRSRSKPTGGSSARQSCGTSPTRRRRRPVTASPAATR